MNAIDAFLDRTSTYRLVLSGLWVLAGVALVETFLGWLSYTPIDLILSLFILLFTARATNALCTLFTHATPAPEAASITAFILFFILSPLQNANEALFFIIAAAIAVLSKYVLSIHTKAVFNPAALSVFILSITASALVVWWVATPVLLPFVLVLGFLVVHKTRQGKLFWIFAITAIVVSIGKGLVMGSSALASASALITIMPLIFFGTLMLTDPQTMPASEGKRTIYALLVGVLFPLSFAFGPFVASPELALLIGNAYAFAFDTRKRIALTFHSVAKLSKNIYEFSFVPGTPLQFQAGQSIELTAYHKPADNRGIRRYFTIVSAPQDYFVRIAAAIPVESSTFKDTLLLVKNQSETSAASSISAHGPYGSFVLPRDPNKKILAIASGVGIVPFMSMCRYIAAQHERRDIVLIYTVATPLDFAYQEELDSFKAAIGLQVLYLPTDFSELSGWEGPSGYLTQALLETVAKDFKSRLWYIAGPSSSVQSHLEFAQKLGIPKSLIKKESFPGF